MPAKARGSVFPTSDGYGIPWPENGKRPQKTGFRTKTQARDWLNENVAPRLTRGIPSADITFDAFCDVFLERHDGSERTIQTQRERLAAARKQFGTWPLRDIEGAADDIARWRTKQPTDGARYRHTRAFAKASLPQNAGAT